MLETLRKPKKPPRKDGPREAVTRVKEAYSALQAQNPITCQTGSKTTSKPGGTQTLWAVINADGTTARGSGVQSSKKEPAPPGGGQSGEYDVIFKRNVSSCAYIASFANERQTGEVSASSLGPGTPNGVYVQTVTDNGTREVYSDSPFHLAVFC